MCLLIRGHQKLRKNNYNNSIFLLGESPLTYQIQSIHCAVVHCTDTAGLERGGWCSTSTLPSSLARQTQGSWHSLAGSTVSALFVCTQPGGGFPVQWDSIFSCARITGVSGPGCTVRHMQIVQALQKCIGEKWPKSSVLMLWPHMNCAEVCIYKATHGVYRTPFSLLCKVKSIYSCSIHPLEQGPVEPWGWDQPNLRESWMALS